jgi:hypothetical protein
MKPRITLLPGLSLLSTASITAGYLLAGSWMILPALLGMGLLFFFARRRSVFEAASVLLVGAAIFAVVGVMMGLSFTLMLLGCIGALSSWDLMLFSQSLMRATNREDIGLLEGLHYQSLVIAILGGVLFSLTAANFALDLPFIVILMLCAVALGGVYFGVQNIIGVER